MAVSITGVQAGQYLIMICTLRHVEVMIVMPSTCPRWEGAFQTGLSRLKSTVFVHVVPESYVRIEHACPQPQLQQGQIDASVCDIPRC